MGNCFAREYCFLGQNEFDPKKVNFVIIWNEKFASQDKNVKNSEMNSVFLIKADNLF